MNFITPVTLLGIYLIMAVPVCTSSRGKSFQTTLEVNNDDVDDDDGGSKDQLGEKPA